ncbi:MAG TPA: FtsX-like permease family protein, partial [Cyclobacteriaceae bacterium]
NYQEIISGLEKVWKTFESVRPFTPFFLNERLNNLYEDEKTTGDMIGYFSLLAIFIACMGLLGLATYSTQVRVKEIGIRKVLGASSGNLIGLISRDFSLLVFIAMLLSWPVAWYLMNEWLSTFTYRVNMSLGIFVISGIGTLLLALMVISINAFKAATANPVDSLRNE